MLHTPSKNNMSNLRALLTPHNKLPPDLRHALSLLNLTSLPDLEDRLLSLPAFLTPFSVFRDSILLLAPECMPTPTLIKGAGSGTSRLDLLWFYTQFDEGSLRYDRRADRYSAEYTSDTSAYGVIDKANWRVDEYEKHLFAWLLQELKVGKAYSPWRFEYFELKNICTAWEDVLVPIVNAVRASYDVRGRRYYGRLALFVEERCPSRLAFPEGNVGVPEGGLVSPTPFRVVSAPRRVSAGITRKEDALGENGNGNGVLSRRHYDETEKELRDVYPQYGGLVERPKFKHKMDEWLAEQRARANRRKEHERKDGEVLSAKPHVVYRNRSRNPSKQLPATPRVSSRQKRDGSSSPIKHVTDSIKRSFSLTMASMKAKEEAQKSPMHGVTRQLQFAEPRTSQFDFDDSARSSMVITPLPRPSPYTKKSEASVYTSIRNSNPFSEELPDDLKARGRSNTADSVNVAKEQQARRSNADTTTSLFSPMGPPSAIPHPLNNTSIHDYGTNATDHPAMRTKASYRDARAPSYEGTAYKDEISLTDLHNQRMQATRSPMATRLPAPIVAVPYCGPRVASADKEGDGVAKPSVLVSPSKQAASRVTPDEAPVKRNTSPAKHGVSLPKAIASTAISSKQPPTVYKPTSPPRQHSSPPSQTAWPGFTSDSDSDTSLPPLPPKSPERQQTTRVPGHLHNPRMRTTDISRIVSKENIRAALGGLTPKSSAESLATPKPPVRMMSPGGVMKLQTFNANLFPRKEEERGAPVGGRSKKDNDETAKEKEGDGNEGRYEPGGAFELEVLGVKKKG